MLAAVEAGVPVCRVHAGGDQARGGRLRTRREARRCSRWSSCCSASPRCRRRTTPPTRWRSRSATCTRSRRARVGAVQPAAQPRDELAATSWRHCTAPPVVIAHLRGTHLRETSESHRRRRRAASATTSRVPLSTFYGLGDAGTDDRAAHSHARARGCARALRLRDAARAGAVRAADRRQRHRPEAGAGGAVRASSRTS